VALLALPACAQSDARQDPFAALRAGRYDEAIEGLRGLAANSDDARIHRALVEALMDVGRYDDAERAARAGVERARVGAQLANALGEVLYARGRADEAAQSYQKAIDGNASDAATARLNLAILQFRKGQIAESMRGFDTFIDLYNNNDRLSPEDLTAIGTAVRYLGRTDPQLFHDAVKAYGEAMTGAARGTDRPRVAVEPRLLMGEVFLEKYDSREAQTLFREVLEENPNNPRALLGMAAAKYFDGSTEPLELIKKSLEVNPNYVDALVFHATLLLDLENYDAAEAEARKALAINPSSLEALASLAGVHYLEGDERGYEEVRTRALALNPVHADFYNNIAELAVRQRKYKGAVALARLAIALDSASWWGWGIMGLNQLRTGELAEAKTNLDKAFAGDPYNVWIKNTLDLMDTFGQYRTSSTDRFTFMLHGDEAELLAPYAGALAEEAYTKLSERYRYAPQTPVRVEVYPSHADFSVRTVGLGGLGALGVSFGNLLAMDSPAARERGEFNWGSTLWHEITHTITLGLTDHRIPRWLTEGLSVLEERRARAGWGDDLSLEFIIAYKRGDVLPVSQLNSGFVRPKYPAQVMFSYYEASLVAEMIERDMGFDAILRMLQGYKEGKTDEQVFRDVLKLEPKALDDRFEAYLKQRFATQMASVRVPAGAAPGEEPERGGVIRGLIERMSGGDDFISQIAQGKRLLDDGKLDEAKTVFERAKAMFPEYVGGESPYRHLAEIHKQKGDLRAAAAELSKIVAVDENDFDTNVALATLLEQLGDRAGAAAALDRAVYISPYEVTLHTKLAELYAATGDKTKVVRERQAVVALKPVDRAEALYQLALAYYDAGDRVGARREVLKALEQAPSFDKAQQLLLRIRS
jgi:tetratricopeptide (TPR) repeat protein